MADANTEYVLAGLRDAHAMEAATVDNLKRLTERTGEYVALNRKLQEHLAESERQRDEIGRQLEKLGSEPSTLKDVGMRVTGQLQALATQFASDTVPKDCMAAHGYENFEIASYKSLGAAAEVAGLSEVAAMCDRFIDEQRSMANFLFDNIGDVTRDYMRTRQGS